VAHPHPVRVIRFSPPLAAHRAVQVALAPSLLQARLCLIRVRVLVSHHPAVVQVHLAHLPSHPHPLLAAQVVSRPVALASQAHAVLHFLRVLHPATLDSLQALVALHSQALRAVRRLLVAAHLPSHHALQALHPVIRPFLPALVLALAHHRRARVFKNYKASIGIQIVRTVDIRLVLWDLALVLQIE